MIINNMAFKGVSSVRKGSEVDLQSVKCLFSEELDFLVEVHTNLTQHEMELAFEDAAKRDTSYGMFISVVLTHGAQPVVVNGGDWRILRFRRLSPTAKQGA